MTAFKVCADGHYLPMSNKAGEGFENRIAELLANEMGLPLEYYWFPQRMGFIRNTLRKKDQNGESLCDVVMGVPYRYELAITTKPLYASTYALVFKPEGELDAIQKTDDVSKLSKERLSTLKIAMHERNPGVRWLADEGLVENLAPYVAQLGDPNIGPNELEERDLLSGEVDMAVVWGPVAGRIKSNAAAEGIQVRVVPFKSTARRKMSFAMALGVHFPNRELRDQLDELLVLKRDEIDAILDEFNIPRVELAAVVGKGVDDDDDDDDDDDKGNS